MVFKSIGQNECNVDSELTVANPFPKENKTFFIASSGNGRIDILPEMSVWAIGLCAFGSRGGRYGCALGLRVARGPRAILMERLLGLIPL